MIIPDLPDELKPIVQAYVDAHGTSFEDACTWLLRKGIFAYQSERTSEAIPEALRGLIVSDYHTVSGWARFKGTRMPLQVLVDNLKAGMTPEEFIEDYQSLSPEGIAVVQDWLKTLPAWDPGDRENIPEPYRFMYQDELL